MEVVSKTSISYNPSIPIVDVLLVQALDKGYVE